MEFLPSVLPLLAPFVLVFLVGLSIGYGIRAAISSRRRAAARQRFIETGSYRRQA